MRHKPCPFFPPLPFCTSPATSLLQWHYSTAAAPGLCPGLILWQVHGTGAVQLHLAASPCTALPKAPGMGQSPPATGGGWGRGCGGPCNSRRSQELPWSLPGQAPCIRAMGPGSATVPMLQPHVQPSPLCHCYSQETDPGLFQPGHSCSWWW